MAGLGPYVSWAVIGVAGAGAYWYYTSQQKNKRGRVARAASVTETATGSRKKGGDKSKRKKDNSSATPDHTVSDVGDVTSTSIPSSGNGQIKQRRGGKKESNVQAKSPAVDVLNGGTSSHVDKDEEVDDKEFAKQFSSVKTGTSLTKSTNAEQKTRSKKQKNANGFLNAGQDATSNGVKAMSGNSSTTGADGDDDLSPLNSPPFTAIKGSSAQSDVADMLEAPAPGPSVLRLTEPTQPQHASKPKQNKPAQEPENKKQRQRRAKNEARKAERESAEKERRVLLEKQLRTAREAEGRPAKNGVAVSKPPAANAWSIPNKETSETSSHQNTASNISGPLLDTLDENENKSSSTSSLPVQKSGTSAVLQLPQTPNVNPPPDNIKNTSITKSDVTKTSPANGNSHTRSWDKDLPSEEEQLRLLSELDSDNGWKEVKKRDKSATKNGLPNAASQSSYDTRGPAAGRATNPSNAKQAGYSSVRAGGPAQRRAHTANRGTTSRNQRDSSGNPESYFTTRGDGSQQPWLLYDFPEGQDSFTAPSGYTFYRLDPPGFIENNLAFVQRDPWDDTAENRANGTWVVQEGEEDEDPWRPTSREETEVADSSDSEGAQGAGATSGNEAKDVADKDDHGVKEAADMDGADINDDETKDTAGHSSDGGHSEVEKDEVLPSVEGPTDEHESIGVQPEEVHDEEKHVDQHIEEGHLEETAKEKHIEEHAEEEQREDVLIEEQHTEEKVTEQKHHDKDAPDADA